MDLTASVGPWIPDGSRVAPPHEECPQEAWSLHAGQSSQEERCIETSNACSLSSAECNRQFILTVFYKPMSVVVRKKLQPKQ
ncbi:uncharacterized protein [Zea mays]|uniref:uncharacterized protein isoform X4 n=1 Tax=Zea mays TaxID=4577 RepID=UPI0009A9C43E|nr:uncharacterized protein LOC100192682 isoform X4 [Zea mays]|eukprot:XP_020402966.1 uncharacterized LOC100192682 isoform X4 [Zea mays]